GDAGFVARAFYAQNVLHVKGLQVIMTCSIGFPVFSVYFLLYFEELQRMPTVRVRKNERFGFALRRFRRSWEKPGVVSEARGRDDYEKPTQDRKRKNAAAVKRHLRKIARERVNRRRLY